MEFLDRTFKDGGSLTYAWFEAMHTRMDLILWDEAVSISDLHSLCESVLEETVRIEGLASCFLPDSEISGINSSPVGCPVKTTAEMFSIIERCIAFNKSTGGLFDIAVSEEKPGVPLEDKLHLDKDTLSVTRLDAGTKLNLSGYLKGYALDKVAELVRLAGVSNALLSFGNSSIYAVGNHPGGEGWPVATLDGDEYVLHDECLTTSGNSREDRKHIIDPMTGRFVEGRSMVSVRTSTAEEGEVMSIAAFLKSNTN